MNKKIFIGIPCYSNPAPEVLQDYMRLAFYLGRRCHQFDFFLGIKTKSEQFRARNAIVEAAYTVGADFLLMIDDDHIFDVENTNAVSDRYGFIEKLVGHLENDPGLGIVGGLYFHRGGECRPVLMEEKEGQYFYLRDDQIKHGLQEVDVQGGGCMLIRMKVFDKIGSKPFEPEFEYGTDFQVCRKAKKAGFKIASDTSIEIGHLKNTRSIVTGKNRHLHYAQTMDESDTIRANSVLGKIYRDYRDDIMEYLGIENHGVLIELANQYQKHQLKFAEYEGRLEDYYRESGTSYLARACFIRNNENHKRFDDFVLQTVKADFPGVGIDFGCGAAPIGFELARRGQTMHFYDVEGSAPFEFLKWRAKKYNLAGVRVFFNTPNPKVDYVLALDSIEHIVDWQEKLSWMAGCLKPAGCLITNFMLLGDTTNTEHIFMNHSEFMGYVTKIGLWPINAAVFQKREDLIK